jgi:N-acetylglutamate synthase-like GNAT family acetyltransferase
MTTISPCTDDDVPAIAEVINESALAYKGVIPADRWHEPYMPVPELKKEIARGVRFYACRRDGVVLGVMGVQDVKDVTLIRHAYVRTACRGQGMGRELLQFMYRQTARPVLIGAWKAATWAVQFYEKNGFQVVSDEEKNRLLRIYWTIPDRQVEESVVLTDERWRKSHPSNAGVAGS